MARAAREHAEGTRLTAGVSTAALIAGTLSWTEGDAHRVVPILLRPMTFEAARDGDTQLTLHHAVHMNPVLVSELRDRLFDRAFDSTVQATLAGTQFDPRPLWNEIRSIAEIFSTDAEVAETLLLGSFDDPEQRLMDDIEESLHLIASNLVLASVAGDRTVKDELLSPLAATPPGDRDPFAERGLGDLDDIQFAILDTIATGRNLFVQVPPGADPIGTAAAIAADGAASGRRVAVVGGSTRSVDAVADVLAGVGAADLYVSGAVERWNTAARAALLESMTSSTPAFDDTTLRAIGERLLEARARLRERFDDLHRKRTPWGVSAYRAVQEIVRLTSGDAPPSTKVRLDASIAEHIAEVGIDVVAAAAARTYEARVAAETQGALFPEEAVAGAGDTGERAPIDTQTDAPFEEGPTAPSTGTTPEVEPQDVRRWWEGTILDADLGADIDQVLATFLVRHLPRLREAAAEAAIEVGIDEAPSFVAWVDQVRLFDDVRQTLERFSPAVFQGALSDLIAVTAPDGSAMASTLPKRERKAASRRAEEVLRPGRGKEGLHEALLEAHHRAVRWRAYCGGGGWPRVPDGVDVYIERVAEAWALWSRLAPMVEAVTGKDRLAERSWDEMVMTLESLTETRHLPVEDAEVREAQQSVVGMGFDALLDDMAERKIPTPLAAIEVEFAWWASAFEGIVAQSPRLAEYGVIGSAVEDFLDRDSEFAAARVSPLLRAVAERRRAVIGERQDDARDLFATLVEGGDGPLKSLWERFPELVGALRPVILCSVEQASEMMPPSRVLDTVVLMGIEATDFAEIVPAVARANQVVVLGDFHAATKGALAGLKETLPDVTLHANPLPWDSRVTAILAEYGYGGELESLPAAGRAGTLEVVTVDAIGPAVAGDVGTETTHAEVVAAIARATEAANSGDSVVVVAGNDAHASECADSLEAYTRESGRVIPVITLGRTVGVRADAVILTLGYGPDTHGEYPERLGILSSPAGAQAFRQALVASTRDLVVVTALPPEYLGWAAREGLPGHGVEALADLVALASAGSPHTREQEGDWLLADLARRLENRGAAVRQRYGAGGATIPLVVGRSVDDYTVAVVTDDVPPRPGTSLRDAMRWQRTRLEALGWTVVPLFTLDVFMDPDAAADQVVKVAGLVPPEPAPTSAPEESVLPLRSLDDTDVGWGLPDEPDRDSEIKRDRPPHW
jgi:hypothetical protein